MQEEIWKDIPNYEGLYQVSNLGSVKSLAKIKLNNGKHPFTTQDKILKPSVIRYNYLSIGLVKNNSKKCFKIHQLVAMAFLNHTPCGYKKVVDHINDNPSDNRVENLQIITQRENTYKTQGKYSSMYKGVSFCKQTLQWKAQIVINNKNYNLGRFKTEQEASSVYQNKLKEIS